MRLLCRLLGYACVVAVITLVLLEVTLRGAQHAGLFSSQERATTLNTFYRDENPEFGVWHPPSAEYHARTECFDVVYRSNVYGARDGERSERSAEPRVVVLGDSFVEGVGVAHGRRMTDVLEERTGLEHLNFGTAGSFSATQEWRLYETLASRFDHDAVFLFIFPNNDFLENDPARDDGQRYRPYLERRGNGFEVVFFTTLAESRRTAERQLPWNRLYNAFLIYRVGVFFEAQLRMRMTTPSTRYGYIGYEQIGPEDVERVLFAYRKIRDAAAGRPLVLFTIPRLNEFLYFAGEAYPSRLPELLRAFAEQEPGIEYYDLMPGFLDDWMGNGRRFGDYFLPCDGHWSELGNRKAAELVSSLAAATYRAIRARSQRSSAAP